MELRPGGKDLAVTNENKLEYVTLVAEQRLSNGIRSQIDKFLEGFWELIPLDLVSMFSPAELELLMCGLPNIDREDLRANMVYVGYTAESQQIVWLWRAINEMADDDLAKLVQFVTGTSKVPLEGFSALQGMHGLQRFTVTKTQGNERLPTAHTWCAESCTPALTLPAASTSWTCPSMQPLCVAAVSPLR